MPDEELPVADEADDLPGDEPIPPKRAAAKPAAEAPQPPAVTHPPRVLKLAEAVGISAAEAAAMSKAELLDEIEYAEKVVEIERRRAAVLVTGNRAAPPALSVPTPPAPAKSDLEEAFGVELDDEIEERDDAGNVTGKRKPTAKDFSPAVLKILKRQAEAIKELSEKAGALSKHEEVRQRQLQDDLLDAAFEAMGPRYEKVLGKGKGATLLNTPAMQKRIAVFRQAGVDWTADGPEAIAKKIADAGAALYGDLIDPEPPAKPASPGGGAYAGTPAAAVPAKPAAKATRADAKRNEKIGEWAGSHAARATQRNGAAEPKGVQAADKAVAAKMVEMGMEPGPLDRSEEEDELPE